MHDGRCTGTYEEEQKMEDIVYGVTRQLHSWNPVYAQVSESIRHYRPQQTLITVSK